MKLIHISDLHLGKRINEFSMLDDQRYILEQVVKICVEEHAAALLLAGDIYDRHIPLVKELISREPLPAPTFWLNPEVKDFYQFTRDDVKLIDYETGPQITNIPIAI